MSVQDKLFIESVGGQPRKVAGLAHEQINEDNEAQETEEYNSTVSKYHDTTVFKISNLHPNSPTQHQDTSIHPEVTVHVYATAQ